MVQAIFRSPDRSALAVTVVKSVHGLIFLAEAYCALYVLYSGLSDRVSALTKLSMAVMVGEGLVLLSNGGRCPLTDLAEELGSEHGSVSDIFLPGWFAARVPVVFSTPLAIGIAMLGLRRLARSRRRMGAGA
jgi:hypothetical protein